MLTQQLAASRSEDDGRISDMSFHDEPAHAMVMI